MCGVLGIVAGRDDVSMISVTEQCNEVKVYGSVFGRSRETGWRWFTALDVPSAFGNGAGKATSKAVNSNAERYVKHILCEIIRTVTDVNYPAAIRLIN